MAATRFLRRFAPLLFCIDVLASIPGGPAATVGAAFFEDDPDFDAPAPRLTAPVPAPRGDFDRYAKLIESASHAHGVEPALVHALIFAESAYDPNAVSTAGASGLMQLMPATARRYGVRDVFDPADNIRGGVKYLKELLELFDGNVELAVAAYNAGHNAVIRAGHQVPPYPQTRAYVPKVINMYRELRLRND